MKTLVLVFHPDLSASRVNSRWAEEMDKQDSVTVHRVYEAYPDEQIDVAAEQRLLEQHDRIVLQFPFYWYSTPPLLKKWEDAVLAYGWAFGSKGDKLHGKELLIAVSVGAAQENYTSNGAFKYTLPELLRPLQTTSNMIGTRYMTPFASYGVMQMSDEQLEQSAKDYVAHALKPEIAPKFAELSDEVLLGDVWKRKELSLRDRSLISISSLITGGDTEALKIYFGTGASAVQASLTTSLLGLGLRRVAANVFDPSLR